MSNATQRKVINRATGEELPVTATAFGTEQVIFTTSAGDITFSNVGNTGDLLNDEYTVQEVAPEVPVEAIEPIIEETAVTTE